MIPRLATLLLATLCCAWLSGCPAVAEKPLRLGTNQWIGYEPFYLAREQNALDRDKVRLIEYTTSVPVIDAMRNGLIDAAALTLDESLALQHQVKDLRLVAVLDFSNGADILVGKPDVLTLADLRGKRVAVENQATGAYLLSRALASAGMSLQDVVQVPVAVDQHEAAIADPSIAAIVCYQPIATRLLNGGNHRLFDSSRIPGEIVDVLVVREATLRQKPANLRHLLRAWAIGREYLQRDQDTAIRLMQARQQLTPAQIKASLQELRFPDAAENRQLLQATSPLQQTILKLKQHMLQTGLLSASRPAPPLLAATGSSAE